LINRRIVMHDLNLNLEALESIEAPLSNEFWEGVGIAFTIVAGVAAVAAVAT
jgi:hypothetical protein